MGPVPWQNGMLGGREKQSSLQGLGVVLSEVESKTREDSGGSVQRA